MWLLALEYGGSLIQASKVFLTTTNATFANAHDQRALEGSSAYYTKDQLTRDPRNNMLFYY
jgi:hypothetical protein